MQSRITLRQLEYLVAVGQLGSVTLAAERLAVSAPSISTAISQLEAEFGLPLFVRKHAQGLTATPAGRSMIDQSRLVLEAAQRLNSIAAQYKDKVEGELKVGCLSTFAQMALPRLRKSFLARFPEVSFRQFERHQADLIDGLRNAALDVGLTYDLAIPADLSFEPLATLPPFAILPETHALAARASVAIAELAPYPMILLDLPLSAPYFLGLFEAAGCSPTIAERTQDIAVAHSLVGHDFGYSIANSRPLSQISPDGQALRFVPIEEAAKPLSLGILSAAGATSSRTIGAFTEHCRNQLAAGLLEKLSIRGKVNGP